MTALSALHMLLIWLVAISINVFTLARVFSQPRPFTDELIIASSFIAAAVLPIALTFKSLHPEKKEESQEPVPLLELGVVAPAHAIADSPESEQQADVPAHPDLG